MEDLAKLTKTVTVFSTMGKNAQEFQSSAKNWQELQKELSELKISYSGMKAVIGETRLTIESPNAIVPAENFTLYLMPVKVKSGADRKAIFEEIKTIVAKNPAAKSNFIVDGKNMTQLSTDMLVTLLAKYKGEKPSGTAVAASTAPVKEKAGKVTPVPVKEKTNAEKAADLVASIKELMEDDNSDKEEVCEYVMKKVEALAALVGGDIKHSTTGGSKPEPKTIPSEPVETAAQRAEREAKEKQAARNKELEAKAREMARDFKDLGSF